MGVRSRELFRKFVKSGIRNLGKMKLLSYTIRNTCNKDGYSFLREVAFMKHFARDLFSVDVTTDEEFDELVSELLHVEPPASLVENILSSVARIPLPKDEADQSMLKEDQGGLIVRHGLALPS
jgi:hypothetical protein